MTPPAPPFREAGGGWLDAGSWPARIRRLGPLRYSDLGRRRLVPLDSGSVPALGRWIAGAADRWWASAGRPDPYTLVVVSADDGSLARAVLDAAPACGPALRYVVVDPDAGDGTEAPPAMARLLPLEKPAFLYPATGTGGGWDGPDVDHGDDDGDGGDGYDDGDGDGEMVPARGVGPLATYLADVPALGAFEEGAGALVVIGLLSRLPYDLYERHDVGWVELRLAEGPTGLAEVPVPVPDEAAGDPWARRRRLVGATDWLRRTLHAAPAGTLAVVDDWAGGLELAQLAQVRRPLETEPALVPGTRLAVVHWRLG